MWKIGRTTGRTTTPTKILVIVFFIFGAASIRLIGVDGSSTQDPLSTEMTNVDASSTGANLPSDLPTNGAADTQDTATTGTTQGSSEPPLGSTATSDGTGLGVQGATDSGFSSQHQEQTTISGIRTDGNVTAYVDRGEWSSQPGQSSVTTDGTHTGESAATSTDGIESSRQPGQSSTTIEGTPTGDTTTLIVAAHTAGTGGATGDAGSSSKLGPQATTESGTSGQSKTDDVTTGKKTEPTEELPSKEPDVRTSSPVTTELLVQLTPEKDKGGHPGKDKPDPPEPRGNIWAEHSGLFITVIILIAVCIVVSLLCFWCLRCRGCDCLRDTSRDKKNIVKMEEGNLGPTEASNPIPDAEIVKDEAPVPMREVENPAVTSNGGGQHISKADEDNGWVVPLDQLSPADQEKPEIENTKL